MQSHRGNDGLARQPAMFRDVRPNRGRGRRVFLTTPPAGGTENSERGPWNGLPAPSVPGRSPRRFRLHAAKLSAASRDRVFAPGWTAFSTMGVPRRRPRLLPVALHVTQSGIRRRGADCRRSILAPTSLDAVGDPGTATGGQAGTSAAGRLARLGLRPEAS